VIVFYDCQWLSHSVGHAVVNQILVRDNYRCCITGRVEPAVYDNSNAKAAAQPAAADLFEVAEAAHIIPFSLNNFDNTKADEVRSFSFAGP
jgi:hypothetical protein